jgi:hypothetical protein
MELTGRPGEDVTAPATVDKPLPAITEDMEQLHLHGTATTEQETRRALTESRIFENVPAVLSPIRRYLIMSRHSPSPLSSENSRQTQTL